jgi:hypothetical protein
MDVDNLERINWSGSNYLFDLLDLQCVVFEKFLWFLQHTTQEEVNTLAMHGVIFTSRLGVEILPTYFSVFPPNVAISQ